MKSRGIIRRLKQELPQNEVALDQKKLQELYEQTLAGHMMRDGAKSPCLVCNPDTSRAIADWAKRGLTEALANLIVVCDDCKTAILSIREIVQQ